MNVIACALSLVALLITAVITAIGLEALLTQLTAGLVLAEGVADLVFAALFFGGIVLIGLLLLAIIYISVSQKWHEWIAKVMGILLGLVPVGTAADAAIYFCGNATGG